LLLLQQKAEDTFLDCEYGSSPPLRRAAMSLSFFAAGELWSAAA